MAPVNNFLPFCPTDTGTNLLTQSDYAAASNRTNGNQPGVASSKLNNKAVRQSSFITSQLAQLVSNQLAADVLDNGVSAQLLAQLTAALKPYAPNIRQLALGSGTWKMNYIFFIASGSATAGATYTNNAITFTVVSTVAAGVEIRMTGSGDPAASGTLTKTSGTGDATLTFYAFRKPLFLVTTLVGGGGGGAGSGTTDGAGTQNGNDSVWTDGSLVATASKGSLGTRGGNGGTGGTPSVTGASTDTFSLSVPGEGGDSSVAAVANMPGGRGGRSVFPGAGQSSPAAAAQSNASGYGSGGTGGGIGASGSAGAGGGAGGFLKLQIPAPSSSYTYTVGAGGNGGGNGTSGFGGSNGAPGTIIVEEHYQ